MSHWEVEIVRLEDHGEIRLRVKVRVDMSVGGYKALLGPDVGATALRDYLEGNGIPHGGMMEDTLDWVQREVEGLRKMGWLGFQSDDTVRIFWATIVDGVMERNIAGVVKYPSRFKREEVV
jgi:hypothetical protein